MVRTFLYTVTCFLFKLDIVRCMDAFIVGGKPAKHEYFAYSAFLTVEVSNDMFVCGSSVINQNVLLTAAHCFEDLDNRAKVIARAGSANKLRGAVRHGSKFAMHVNYNPDTVKNDIALLYIKNPFVLGETIKRVIISKHPPKRTTATVAGWGLTNEQLHRNTEWLQEAQQKLMSSNECKKELVKIPDGCICGGSKNSKSYASSGDSGSALIVDGCFQIGLVSFKRPDRSVSIVVYTDVPYFYNWIYYTSRKLFCS